MRTPSFVVNAGNSSDKTVVVVGAFRGGTTMVSAAVNAIGIPMRPRPPAEIKDYDNWEDLDMQKILHEGKLFFPILSSGVFAVSDEARRIMNDRQPALTRLIGERNNSGSWGWKYPFTTFWLLASNLLQELRNPHVIAVFRDPIAVWQHECLTGWLQPSEFQRGAKTFNYSCVQTQMLQRLVMTAKVPLMAVSFERASKDQESKRQLVHELQDFLHVSGDGVQLDSALANMVPQTRPGG